MADEKMDPAQLGKILADHERWVESGGNAGNQADLSGADLRGARLEGAKLSGARLEGADLTLARLDGADLSRARLEEARLYGARLEGADLSAARLEGARLRGANFSRARLFRANLSGASLIDTSFADADLREADFLQPPPPKVQAREDAENENGGEKEENQSEARRPVRPATGLQAAQLGGANVSNAKLPPEVSHFQPQLDVISDACKNARTLFITLLAGCFYTLLTITSATDAQLIVDTASTELPIIRSKVPIVIFYRTAPFILLGVYLYFHFYLQRLWEKMRDVPAVLPDGRPLDKAAYPWLLNGYVRRHFYQLRNQQPPMMWVQMKSISFLVWWLVPMVMVALFLKYLPRHDPLFTGLHVAFMVLTFVLAMGLSNRAKITLRGIGALFQLRRWPPARLGMVCLIAQLTVVGLGLWVAIPFSQKALSGELEIGRADLRNANLKGLDLVKKDLRNANLQGAILAGADLGGANLAGAYRPRGGIRGWISDREGRLRRTK